MRRKLLYIGAAVGAALLAAGLLFWAAHGKKEKDAPEGGSPAVTRGEDKPEAWESPSKKGKEGEAGIVFDYKDSFLPEIMKSDSLYKVREEIRRYVAANAVQATKANALWYERFDQDTKENMFYFNLNDPGGTILRIRHNTETQQVMVEKSAQTLEELQDAMGKNSDSGDCPEMEGAIDAGNGGDDNAE